MDLKRLQQAAHVCVSNVFARLALLEGQNLQTVRNVRSHECASARIDDLLFSSQTQSTCAGVHAALFRSRLKKRHMQYVDKSDSVLR